MRNGKKRICLLLAAALIGASALFGCEMADGQGSVSGSDVSGSDYVSPSDSFTPHRFGKSDLTVNGSLSLGMTVEEVKAVLGQPDSEGTFANDDFIYGTYTALTYGDLSLTFFDTHGGSDLTLGTIWSKSETDLFAGGLHVGSPVEKVIAAFTYDKEREPLYLANTAESCGDYIYGNYTRDNFIENKPKDVIEYAYVNRWGLESGYETENTLEYYYADPLTWNEDETAYSGDLYSLVFYVDGESHLVTNIMLNDNFMS